MTAFDSKPFLSTTKEIPKDFQKPCSDNIDPVHPAAATASIRFLVEPEICFEACECCLIMADALKAIKVNTGIDNDSGIY